MKPLPFEDIATTWRQRLRASIRKARTELDSDKGLHQARISVKHARALVKLGMGHKRLDKIDRALRDVSRPLSAARDAEVMLATAKRNGVTPALIAALEAKRALAFRALARQQKPLRAELKQLAERRLPHPRDDTLQRGLACAEKRARKAARCADARPSSARLHALRKRCKDLRYQHALFGRRSRAHKEKIERLRRVCVKLGEARDLKALCAWLKRRSAPVPPQWTHRIQALEANGVRLAHANGMLFALAR